MRGRGCKREGGGRGKGAMKQTCDDFFSKKRGKRNKVNAYNLLHAFYPGAPHGIMKETQKKLLFTWHSTRAHHMAL